MVQYTVGSNEGTTSASAHQLPDETLQERCGTLQMHTLHKGCLSSAEVKAILVAEPGSL